MALSFDAKTKIIPELSHTDIIKLKKDLSPGNPFKHQIQGLKNITMNEKNINQSARVFLSHFGNTPVNIRFKKGHADISASPEVPLLPVKLFSNIQLSLSYQKNEISFKKIYIGYLPIPEKLLELALPYAQTLVQNKYPEHYRLLSNIEKVDFTEKHVSVTYHWDRSFANLAKKFGKDILLSKNEQKLIAIYYEQLSKIPRQYLRKKTSIHKIFQPLFIFTKQRIEQGNDPVTEHKAALLTLGVFASGVRINRLLKTENNKYLRHLHYGQLTLSGRSDLMRHFLISAALTVSTNKSLTDMIGLSKEIEDSDGGSGFSFVDLLADRAGVAFAKQATTPDTALSFLDKMIKPGLSPTDFMPTEIGLPESIMQSDFKRIYNNTKSEQYRLMENEISLRISALPLYSEI